MIQRLWGFPPFLPGRRTPCRPVAILLLLLLTITSLPALSGAQTACLPDGDVDQNGSVTATDALLVFQQALGSGALSPCQQSIADVFPSPADPDGSITAADALCVFQKALGSPSCFDILPSSNQPPIANAGADRSVVAGELVILVGTATDPDGTIASHAWTQTGGTSVLLSEASRAIATFVATEVLADETLTFRFTVADDDGETASDDIRVTVIGRTLPAGAFVSVSAGVEHTCGVLETGAVQCWGSSRPSISNYRI